MASGDILILSSSPPKQFTSYHMLSSPPLPSPGVVFRKKIQTLRTGSRAAPIPQNATVTFTSASSLLKISSVDTLQSVDAIRTFKLDVGDIHGLNTEAPLKSAESKTEKLPTEKVERGKGKITKTSRKASVRKDDGPPDGTEARKPRKARAKKGDGELEADGKVKETAPRKSRSKKTSQELGDGGVKQKAPHKPGVKKADLESTGDDPTNETVVRRPRTKKNDREKQFKIARGHLTKPSDSKSQKVDGAVKPKKADSVSKHFNTVTKNLPDPFVDPLDHGLVEAVKRRTDWTPPVPTAKAASMTTPIPIGLPQPELASGGSATSEKGSKGFQDLLGSFGFNKLESNDTEKKLSDGTATRKRKLIELVKTNVFTTTTIPAPKLKAPAKKARTITDLATSAYAQEEDSPDKPAPLLQYFSYQTNDGVTSDGFKMPPRPRSKSPVKPASKNKKGTALAPILLSPESALKQVGNQDYVFGTSSQLAREKSPTLLRDLHEAMQVSNKVDVYDPFDDSFDESAAKYTFAGRGKPVLSLHRNLWSAAARDTGGDLLDVEMVDLANSPRLARQDESSMLQKVASSEASPDEDDVWHNIDEMEDCMKLTQKSTPSEESPKRVGPLEAAIRSELLRSPSNSKPMGASPRPRKQSSPPKASQRGLKIALERDINPEKPDYASYSTFQLAKELALYRFKPVKNRGQMITLLEKCWEGKNRVALGVLGTNAKLKSSEKSSKTSSRVAPPSSQLETASLKKICRPKKVAKSASPANAKSKPKSSKTIETLELDNNDTPLSKVPASQKSSKKQRPLIEAISDSDTPLTPSPPRRHLSQIRTPPLPLQLSSADSADSPELSPSSLQAKLFAHISRAVTKAPASKDPSKPSWHEKILLYDPIILEDLTVWLNTGALEKVGWDGEVEPKEVKKWCESKSICCLWRENLRGGARSRY